jgi:hypothetical protein
MSALCNPHRGFVGAGLAPPGLCVLLGATRKAPLVAPACPEPSKGILPAFFHRVLAPVKTRRYSNPPPLNPPPVILRPPPAAEGSQVTVRAQTHPPRTETPNASIARTTALIQTSQKGNPTQAGTTTSKPSASAPTTAQHYPSKKPRESPNPCSPPQPP